jgi:hypothetical protein
LTEVRWLSRKGVTAVTGPSKIEMLGLSRRGVTARTKTGTRFLDTGRPCSSLDGDDKS